LTSIVLRIIDECIGRRNLICLVLISQTRKLKSSELPVGEGGWGKGRERSSSDCDSNQKIPGQLRRTSACEQYNIPIYISERDGQGGKVRVPRGTEMKRGQEKERARQRERQRETKRE
jgi:hypothetical protein